MVKGLLVGLKCEIAKLEGPMCNFRNLKWLESFTPAYVDGSLEKQGKEEGFVSKH